MEWSEAKAHVGRLCVQEHVDSDLWHMLRRAMPQYIWTDGDSKHRHGFCTACEQWMELKDLPTSVMDDQTDDMGAEWSPDTGHDGWSFRNRLTGKSNHKDYGYCPNCGSRVQFRNLWRGRKSMPADRRFLIIYEKSALSPADTLVAVGYECTSDWSLMDSDEPAVQMDVQPREVCVFPYGKGGQRWVLDWGRDGKYRWRHRKECMSGWRPGMFCGSGGIQTSLSLWMYDAAIEGTPFENVVKLLRDSGVYCSAAQYYDQIRLTERISRWGCIEYLLRLGMDDLAKHAIDGTHKGLLNLRGKTAKAVLRLTDDEWGEVKGKRLRLTLDVLETRKVMRANAVRMNMETIHWTGTQHMELYALENMMTKHRGIDVAKVVKYCRRRSVRLYDYRDMLMQMEELEMDMTDKRLLYPKDFYQMHNRYTERLQILYGSRKAAEARRYDEQIEKRIEGGELSEYWFSAMGLVMRPMVSGPEIVMEGTKQRNCVGNYVRGYAAGNDVLCVVRREGAMDKPLYTVEFGKDGRMIQCRGFRNRAPEDKAQMDLFWRLFEMTRAAMRAQHNDQKKENAA